MHVARALDGGINQSDLIRKVSPASFMPLSVGSTQKRATRVVVELRDAEPESVENLKFAAVRYYNIIEIFIFTGVHTRSEGVFPCYTKRIMNQM